MSAHARDMARDRFGDPDLPLEVSAALRSGQVAKFADSSVCSYWIGRYERQAGGLVYPVIAADRTIVTLLQPGMTTHTSKGRVVLP